MVDNGNFSFCLIINFLLSAISRLISEGHLLARLTVPETIQSSMRAENFEKQSERDNKNIVTHVKLVKVQVEWKEIY